MRILVAGGDRVDAGKTTFSIGLLDRIGAVGFKPRAGNDYWFDHDDVRRAVADGRMYGKDADKLASGGATDHDPEEINPIHRLWQPDPGPGTGLVGQSDRQFVLDRVAGSFVVNQGATVPDPLARTLPIEDAVTVDSVAELNAVTQQRHIPALRAVGERVRRTDPAVVESYGDIARPLQGTFSEKDEVTRRLYDAVAVVEPRRVRVYDGARYVEACEVASATPTDGTLERRVEDAIASLDPLETVELPALAADTRTDPGGVADGYARAYDALVAVASR